MTTNINEIIQIKKITLENMNGALLLQILPGASFLQLIYA